MDVSLAWLELDMRTVLGSRAIDARGCRRRGGTITVRSPPGVATRGMEWPDCARHPGAGPNKDPLALPATAAPARARQRLATSTAPAGQEGADAFAVCLELDLQGTLRSTGRGGQKPHRETPMDWQTLP